MQMKWTSGYWRSSVQFSFGSVGLLLLTFVCFRLGLNVATVGFAYLILIELLALIGSFIISVVLSFFAVACQSYFFAQPLFSLRVDHPEDFLAITAFLTTSIIITGLTAKVQKATERVQASEEQWREVFEHNPVMYFMVDPAGTVLSANSFGATQLGYSVNELIGQSVLKVFFEEDHEAVRNNVGACLESLGQSHSWEIRKVRKDGTELWVREIAKAVRRPDNQLIVLIACEDVTDSKKTEDALRLSEAYMAHAQSLAGFGSWAYKNSHVNGYWDVCEHWSAEMWRIADFDPSDGYPPTELIFSRIHPDDRLPMIEANNQVHNDGRPMNIQYRYYQGDGQLLILHSMGTLIKEDGVATRFVGATLDITEREQRIEQLRRSEALLAEAQRLTRVGGWIYKPPDIALHWSEMEYEIFGIDPREGPPRDLESFLPLVHPDDRQRLRDGVSTILESQQPFEYTYRIVRNDGEIRVIRELGSPVFNQGVVTHFVGASMDITDQERKTEDLRRSQAYLAEGQRLANMGSWAFNPSGHYDFWSAELFRIYGRDPAQGAPTLDQYLDAVHPQDREFMSRTIQTMLTQHSGCDVKKRIVRPDGEVRYIRCVGAPAIENGHLINIYGTAIDVTEQEHLTQQLQRREAYLVEAQKLSHTGSFLWKISTDEHFWSDEMYRIYEIDPSAKITLEMVHDRVHPEDLTRVQQDIDQTTYPFDAESEYRLLLPSGTVKHIHIAVHSRRDASDNIEIFGAVMDITARRHADEELHRTRAQLTHVARVTTLGELTASIAHEVNQPLAAVVASGNACLRWLNSEPPSIENARQSVDRIVRDANRASQVVGRVRNLARKTPPQKARLDINETVEEIIALTQREIRENKISLGTQLSNDLSLILADRIQLQQVILNLIINAIEALSVLSDNPRELSIATKNAGSNGVLLAVGDSGPGLDPERLEEVFDAFYTTKREGMGMGLAVSRSIIEAHGGRLWVSPNQPRGAIFQFTLPNDREELP
jgi:PAS domain S-box-containing protein